MSGEPQLSVPAPLAPFLLFLAMSMQARVERMQLQARESRQEKHLAADDFRFIAPGMPQEQVSSRLGKPARKTVFARRSRDAAGQVVFGAMEADVYSDGASTWSITFADDKIATLNRRAPNLSSDLTREFAAVFQGFYLRLAIFFGCLGIFMNLFRGELVEKSLHFYFLTPVPRSRIMAGKFLAGLAAAGTIFAASTAVQWLTVRSQMDSAMRRQLMSSGHGAHQLAAYLGVTVLACASYGSLFLAAGLRFRNPIPPAGVILVREYLNPFLPAALQKFSIIYCLKALCPVALAHDPSVTGIGAIFATNPDTIAPWTAVLGLLLFTTAVQVASGFWVKRLEIDYTTE